MQAVVTKTVDLPIEHVWEVLADHEGMTHWAPGLKASLQKEGSPERNGVGAVRRIAQPGPVPAIVEEIVGFEPMQRLQYRALSGVPFRGYGGSVELSPAGAGTRIVYSISADQRVPVIEQAALSAVARTLLTLLVRRAKATA